VACGCKQKGPYWCTIANTESITSHFLHSPDIDQNNTEEFSKPFEIIPALVTSPMVLFLVWLSNFCKPLILVWITEDEGIVMHVFDRVLTFHLSSSLHSSIDVFNFLSNWVVHFTIHETIFPYYNWVIVAGNNSSNRVHLRAVIKSPKHSHILEKTG